MEYRVSSVSQSFGSTALGVLALVVLLGNTQVGRAAEVSVSMDPVSSGSVRGFRVHYDGDNAQAPFEGTFAQEGPSPVDFPLDALNRDGPTLTLAVPTCTYVYLGIATYDLDGEDSELALLEGTAINPPRSVVAYAAGEGKLIVRWRGLLGNDSGQLGGYRIHYDRDDEAPYQGTGADQGDSPIVVGPDSTYLELSGLPVGDTVHVVVEAYCADGATQPAEPRSAEVLETLESGCGNGKVEAELQETCDPPEHCMFQEDCEEFDDACVVSTYSGSAEDCTAACSRDVVTECRSGDGCCPAGCMPADDDDCSTECGDGNTADWMETCDPPESCPTACEPYDACYAAVITGSADNCNVSCLQFAISGCDDGDGCCPVGCTSDLDDDCKATEPTAAFPGDGSGSAFPAGATLEGGSCSLDQPSGSPAGWAWTLGLALLGLVLLRRRRR